MFIDIDIDVYLLTWDNPSFRVSVTPPLQEHGQIGSGRDIVYIYV